MITFTYHVIDGHLLKPETPKGNHHREATGTAWTTETPIRKHRNHQNSYKNSSKTIETASMTLPLSISGWIIMNNNFLNTYRLFSSFSYCFITIFAVSQSTYEEWKQKILLFFSFPMSRNVKYLLMWVHRDYKQRPIRSRKPFRFLSVWRERDVINSANTKATNKNSRQQSDNVRMLTHF